MKIEKVYLLMAAVAVVLAVAVWYLAQLQEYDTQCKVVNASVLDGHRFNEVDDSLWPEFTTYEIREANGTALLCEKVWHAERA